MKNEVYHYLTMIPKGKVVTYHQIAAYLGNKNLSRVIGHILHNNPNEEKYPCYKVVNNKGELSYHFAFGGIEGQKQKLEFDHIEVMNNKVDLCKYQWKRDNSMKYELIKTTKKDIRLITEYKLHSIIDDAKNLSEEESLKIQKYVNNKIIEQLPNYKMIVCDNKKIGCFLLEKYEDGYLLDEIYLEKEYRNLGIGTDIIKKNLNHNIYLWVYKENTKAYQLYLKLGFKIKTTTETRYFMEYRIEE